MNRPKFLMLLCCSILPVILVACGVSRNISLDAENLLPNSEKEEVNENEELNSGDEFVKDSRDGQIYRTVTIGSQTWMAENLNYETAESFCLDDRASNCAYFGRHYTWAAAKNACPEGFHLPTSEEWDTLFTETCGNDYSGTKLKSTTGWREKEKGTDDYGFSILPVEHPRHENAAWRADFWSSTEVNDSLAKGFHLYGQNILDLYDKSNQLYIRCIKDIANKKKEAVLDMVASVIPDSSSGITGSSTTAVMTEIATLDSSSWFRLPDNAEIKVSEMTDSRDGKSYKTINVGEQTWMAQNLNYETEDTYCYGNELINCAKYGRLYKKNLAMEICPAGYHLPALIEWKKFFFALGGQNTVGKKLKSLKGWIYGGNGDDSYGFSVVPAGAHEKDFLDEGVSAYFWSSEEVDDNKTYFVKLKYDTDNANVEIYSSEVHQYGMTVYHNSAFSVRCVKD